jgi:UDP-glucose 4-epimerase
MLQDTIAKSPLGRKGKILITGSEGLIGSGLSTYIMKQGYDIVGYDLASKPSPKTILNMETLRYAAEGCIGIVHLAATSRVIDGQKNPFLCWNTNVVGTRNVIAAALECKTKPWVIYASSREVYGQQDVLPVQENCILKPMNIYAESKVEAERLMIEAREQSLNTCILRFSNVFGSVDDHSTRVIPAFCQAALSGRLLKVEGKDNIFDFTYIDDVIDGIAKVIDLLEGGTKNLPPIHFTTGVGTTLLEAANLIIKMTQSSSPIHQDNPRSFDVSSFYGDNQRAYTLLNWKPLFSFKDGIKFFLHKLIQQDNQKTVKVYKL